MILPYKNIRTGDNAVATKTKQITWFLFLKKWVPYKSKIFPPHFHQQLCSLSNRTWTRKSTASYADVCTSADNDGAGSWQDSRWSAIITFWSWGNWKSVWTVSPGSGRRDSHNDFRSNAGKIFNVYNVILTLTVFVMSNHKHYK